MKRKLLLLIPVLLLLVLFSSVVFGACVSVEVPGRSKNPICITTPVDTTGKLVKSTYDFDVVDHFFPDFMKPYSLGDIEYGKVCQVEKSDEDLCDTLDGVGDPFCNVKFECVDQSSQDGPFCCNAGEEILNQVLPWEDEPYVSDENIEYLNAWSVQGRLMQFPSNRHISGWVVKDVTLANTMMGYGFGPHFGCNFGIIATDGQCTPSDRFEEPQFEVDSCVDLDGDGLGADCARSHRACADGVSACYGVSIDDEECQDIDNDNLPDCMDMCIDKDYDGFCSEDSYRISPSEASLAGGYPQWYLDQVDLFYHWVSSGQLYPGSDYADTHTIERGDPNCPALAEDPTLCVDNCPQELAPPECILRIPIAPDKIPSDKSPYAVYGVDASYDSSMIRDWLIQQKFMDVFDCDDTDPHRIGPQPESCNLVDDNCDHKVDNCGGTLPSGFTLTPVCGDGVDNDGDGLVDIADPGCYSAGGYSAGDTSEEDNLPQCSNFFDDDGDGLIDWPDDPGCLTRYSTLEAPECSDGIDNDGDGRTDTDDPGCKDASWLVENPACNDGKDNDGDTKIDLANSPLKSYQGWITEGTKIHLSNADFSNPVYLFSFYMEYGFFKSCPAGQPCGGPNEFRISSAYFYTKHVNGHYYCLIPDSGTPPFTVQGCKNNSISIQVLERTSNSVHYNLTIFSPEPDTSCAYSWQLSETTACSDGFDNDGNTQIDADDPDCHLHRNASLEYVPAFRSESFNMCDNRFDEDGDGLVDAADPDCGDSIYGLTEYDPVHTTSDATTECNDGVDNDGDGYYDAIGSSALIDFWFADEKCTSADDLYETIAGFQTTELLDPNDLSTEPAQTLGEWGLSLPITNNQECVYRGDFKGCQVMDADGDGFKNASYLCSDCTDCDDSDPNINPGMKDDTEDGIDENCNGKDGDQIITGDDSIFDLFDSCPLENKEHHSIIDVFGCWISPVHRLLPGWFTQ